ncbi:MAG TPA: hypothetical protein VNM87_12010 [Candidatus Udaeobacter sp.]|nr:hypothetical protein [Candidatus Udaeobacter sp.]
MLAWDPMMSAALLRRMPLFTVTVTVTVTALAWAAAPGPVSLAHAAGSPPIARSPASADSTLAGLDAHLRAHPDDPAAAKALRQRARRAGQLDSAIVLLKDLLQSHPEAQALRMQLGLAHVDRVAAAPILDLPARAVVASQANRLFSEVIAVEPEQWAPRYARAMTHLLFPMATRHYKAATEDLLKLVELQRTLPPAPHFAQTYLALGDSYIMDKQFEAGRSWWLTGKKLFPEDPELVARLAIDFAELRPTIEARYGFDLPFDTDRDCFDLTPH